MFNQFIRFIEEKKLFDSSQKVLLAVSGGIDSMVLLHLFEKSNFNYAVAHCNFQLRGNDSDLDEKLVREQVEIHSVPAFFETFETEEHAKINGISVEMAARELRYNFFEKVRMENGYDCIATAHHQDDLIETFFLNLSRKTGIKGLSGIKEKSGKIIRPLLFATRQNIEKYATDFFVDFREDATNSEVVFQRNFIRHKILPLFNQLNPSFSNNMLASISNLRDAEKVYDTYLEKEIACVIKKTEDGLMIQIEKLRESSFPQLILLEVLKDFGFNPSVIEEIYQALDSDSGKQFYSASYRVVKDRENLFVLPKSEKKEQVFYIEKDDMELFEPFDLTIEKLNIEVVKIVKDSKVALLDLDEIEFPLLIRKWRQGDYFQPLGMTGFKKLSDFFIDQKIPVHEKENTWLLCSGQKIIWIMGHRIDNRFKVSESTRRVLKIELKTGYAG